MEFQAIILCGPGKGLEPLVSQFLPKALLPIANKPMIYYALEWCQRAGLSSVIVACSSNAEPPISKYITLGYNSIQTSKSMKVEVFGHDGETGSIVKALKDKIKLDFILLPCDFITDLPPQAVVDIHRNQPLKTIGTGIWYTNTLDTIDKKTLKSDLTIHTPISNPHPQLLDIYHRPKGNDQLHVRMSMLWEYPHATISTSLLESHIYLFSRKTLDYDFGDADSASIITATSEKGGSGESVRWKKPWTFVVRDIARDSWRHSNSANRDTVGVYVVAKEHNFIRCKSVSAYLEANRLILKQSSYTAPPTTATANGAAIGRDSLVGIGTVMGEKTSVKRSIVGADCVFGRECRLSGCVVMDGVVLGDGVHLDNCIIGNGVAIEDRSRLVGCTVEGRYVVRKGTQSKNEILRGYSAEGLLDASDEYEDETLEESDEDEDEDDDDEVDEDALVESEGEGIDADDDDLFDRN
ncbi:nucleotide-diphospho-sugar transferase [Lipomyces kononenkoae]|uniref:Nucleotide-diphospho-sugar transferase n=1 Tax=Lipomyces kononenkoae TaxID=34357 RepID=A0ACC3SWI9_LIPKO